jgi:hypothetical protein
MIAPSPNPQAEPLRVRFTFDVCFERSMIRRAANQEYLRTKGCQRGDLHQGRGRARVR